MRWLRWLRFQLHDLWFVLRFKSDHGHGCFWLPKGGRKVGPSDSWICIVNECRMPVDSCEWISDSNQSNNYGWARCKIMHRRGISEKLITIITATYNGKKCQVLRRGKISEDTNIIFPCYRCRPLYYFVQRTWTSSMDCNIFSQTPRIRW